MKNSIEITHNNLPEAMYLLLEKMDSLENSIEQLKNTSKEYSDKKLFTRQETAEFFNCHISTIDLWAKMGKLKKVEIGHKVYYQKTDIELALNKK